MPNKDLVGKKYKIPENIKKFLQTKKNERLDGFQMASNVIENGYITYEHIKKLISKDFNEYENDWSVFKDWCENTLDTITNGIKSSKKIKDDSGMSNVYRKERTLTPTLNENKKDTKKEVDLKLISSVGFIIDKRKVLLVRRSATDNWEPNKWACIGGGVEKGETAKDGFEREAMEETNLLLDKVKFCFSTIEDGNNVYFFIATSFNPNDVKLDYEHSEYNWFTIEELKNLNDTVPNLYNNAKKCIKVSLKKKTKQK